jgi:hypothetical protein
MRQRKKEKELMQDEATPHSKELLQDGQEISSFHQSRFIQDNTTTHTATRKFCLDGCVGFPQCPKIAYVPPRQP